MYLQLQFSGKIIFTDPILGLMGDGLYIVEELE
jgi:hypothetical protein